mgnify:CR=1 FL=1
MAVNKIEIALKEALKKAMVKCNFVEDYEIDQITIEIPKEKSHGDYSTNIAMQLTRLLRKNPRMIAEQLIEAIDKEEANIDSIEIAGPGFINMFMKKDALTSIIKEVLEEKDDYGKSDAGKGIKEAFPFPMGTTGGMCCSVLCMWSIGRNCVSAAQRRQRDRGYHGNDDSRKCRRCRRECRT